MTARAYIVTIAAFLALWMFVLLGGWTLGVTLYPVPPYKIGQEADQGSDEVL